MIVLVDATSSSITVTWPSTEGAERYVLQYRKSKGTTFEVLSDKLQSTQAKKKNLLDEDSAGYLFRVGTILNGQDSVDENSWISHAEPFYLLSNNDEKIRMEPPKVSLGGSNASLLLTWSPFNDTATYEIQMRENSGGIGWETIAKSFKRTEVRKKNLSPDVGYQFRIRPMPDNAKGDETNIVPFSLSSEPVVALGLKSGMNNLFKTLTNGNLVKNGGKETISLDDALGGKEFVLLYASAHWCGPCRQYTPQLVRWYQSLNQQYKTIEVIFLSADHDDNSFQSYFQSMPWLAVGFDDDTREQLMSHIKVTGIPRLCVLNSNGIIIEENAVGKSLDIARWRGIGTR
jgi:thiol-disulfide isomerase/thioredoxin